MNAQAASGFVMFLMQAFSDTQNLAVKTLIKTSLLPKVLLLTWLRPKESSGL